MGIYNDSGIFESTISAAAVDANTTHRSSDGTDHSYINQDVTNGATPAFTNTNFTEATDKNYVTDAQATVIGNTSGTNTGDVVPTQIVTVSKVSGGDFTTIQGAINSISDNATGKRYSILIYPGVYTEDVVMEDWVSLIGLGNPSNTIINGTNSAPLVTFDTDSSTSSIENISMMLAPTTDAQSMVLMTNGKHRFKNCSWVLSSSTQDIGATVINQSGGTLYLDDCNLTYTMSATASTGAKEHIFLNLSGTHTTEIHGIIRSNVTISDTDDNFTYIKEVGTTTYLNIRRIDTTMAAANASHTGTFTFLNTTAVGIANTREIEICHIDMKNSSTLANTANFIVIDSTSNAGVIYSTGNVVNIDSFGLDYFTNIASGDEVISSFDKISTSVEKRGAGTLSYCHTESAGELHVQNVDITDELHINADATALVAGINDQSIDVIVQTTGSTGGDYHVMDVAVGGTGLTEVCAIGTGAGVIPIDQRISVFTEDVAQWYDLSLTTYHDVTGGFGGADILTGDNDILYIGDAAEFNEVQVILATSSIQNLRFNFQYWNGAWVTLPGIQDDTNGFIQNGSWRIEPPADWATTTVNSLTKYFIRATRTRNNIAVNPVPTTLKVSSNTTYKWDENGDLNLRDITCESITATDGVYRSMYIDAGAMVSCTTNGAATGTNEYGTNDIEFDYFAFDGGATEERVQFKMNMPDEWDLGTIKAKFYWSSATSSTANDTVEWAIKAGALADSDAIDTALGTPVVISDTLLANNGTDLQISPATPALTIAGTPALGELTAFEVYRNTDGTDDMTEDAWLLGVSIQYKELSTATAIW